MNIIEYSLGHYGSHLWGRTIGETVRENIEAELSALDPGVILAIDLHDVEVMDFSFASEVVGKILSRRPVEYSDRYVILQGVSVYVKENLDAALQNLELAVLVIRNEDWEVIGKIGGVDIETLQELFEANSATSREMAARLDISITAVNNRLRKLADLGLIRKTRAGSSGGRYRYHWLV